MANESDYGFEIIGESLVIRFQQPALVFPDQVRPIEETLESAGKDNSIQTVVLNCGQVEHISSSVWGTFIQFKKAIEPAGQSLRLCQLDGPVREAFDAMNLGEVIPVYASESEAV